MISQNTRVLQYIQDFGSITTLEAFEDLGVTRLASRIHDLKVAGYEFIKEYEESKNRYGEKVHYIRYKLKEE